MTATQWEKGLRWRRVVSPLRGSIIFQRVPRACRLRRLHPGLSWDSPSGLPYRQKHLFWLALYVSFSVQPKLSRTWMSGLKGRNMIAQGVAAEGGKPWVNGSKNNQALKERNNLLHGGADD